MKILVGLDTTPQSTYVVKEVARLAGNTWADVTLLGIEADTSEGGSPFSAADRTDATHPLIRSLRSHREAFLSHFKAGDSPYAETILDYELVEVENNLWEDLKVCRSTRKTLISRIRNGAAARAILTEARQSPCDLIVMGTAQNGKAEEMGPTPKKVIHDVDTSVLVVAKTKHPRRIVACLDHDRVSQQSLEMINQMVTLYQADLEIVAVSASDKLPGEMDRKISEILKYYTANGIQALVRLVSAESLVDFAAQASRDNLVALWMGKQSLLRRIISRSSMDRLLDTSDYSVLVLR